MTGTWVNVAAIIAGGTLGALLGERLAPRIREIVMQGIGLTVLVVGMGMALKTSNTLLVLASILIGGILGEWAEIQRRLDDSGRWIEGKAARFPFLTRGDFTKGFVTASLVFCPGPMAVLGSIQDGLAGDYSLLTVKSVLDASSAIAFAAAMGMGVTFSAIAVLVFQGTLSLGAGLFSGVMTGEVVTEFTATGGIITIGIGLLLLEIKQVRVANFLPALAVSPALVALWHYFGLP